MQEAGPFPSVPDFKGVISACCWCLPCSRLFKRRGKEHSSLQDLLCVFKSLMLSNRLLLLPLSHTALKTAKTVKKQKSNTSRLGFYFLCVTVCLENQAAIFRKETDQPQCSALFLPSMSSLAILCCCVASLPMLELSEKHRCLPYVLAVLSTVSAPG